jgi:hypothetical protein
MECVCCYNEECLEEDMLACSRGHLYCKKCVQRASEVAIGEGMHQLTCLGQCKDVFALSTLQKALKPNTFSKWLGRIQLAEIEKAEIDGLKQPFVPSLPSWTQLQKRTKFSSVKIQTVAKIVADFATKSRTFLSDVKRWKKTPKCLNAPTLRTK